MSSVLWGTIWYARYFIEDKCCWRTTGYQFCIYTLTSLDSYVDCHNDAAYWQIPAIYFWESRTGLTPWGRDKWSRIRRWHFQMYFLQWKLSNFDWNFIEFCSQGSNWQYLSLRLDNGLAPNRRQAIIWTNTDPIHCHIYAALGGDELIELTDAIRYVYDFLFTFYLFVDTQRWTVFAEYAFLIVFTIYICSLLKFQYSFCTYSLPILKYCYNWTACLCLYIWCLCIYSSLYIVV